MAPDVKLEPDDTCHSHQFQDVSSLGTAARSHAAETQKRPWLEIMVPPSVDGAGHPTHKIIYSSYIYIYFLVIYIDE